MCLKMIELENGPDDFLKQACEPGDTVTVENAAGRLKKYIVHRIHGKRIIVHELAEVGQIGA